MKRKIGVLGVVILLGLAALAQARGEGSYLIVRRAPNFGSVQWLMLWIDGVKVDPVGWGHHFASPIAPGHHVIAFRPSLEKWPKRPNHIYVDIAPGQTCEFMAFLADDRVFLKQTN